MAKGKRNRRKRQSQQVQKRQESNPASSHDQAPEQQQHDYAPTPIVEASWWSGPLPPPNLLEGYDHVVKDGAERVFRMAEDQSKHRRKIENRASRTEAFLRVAGWASATLIGLLAVGGSLFLIYQGRPISGMAALLTSAGILVTAFQGQKRQRERSEQLRLDLDQG